MKATQPIMKELNQAFSRLGDPISRALSWWLDQLTQLLPDWIRRWLQPAQQRYFLQIAHDVYKLSISPDDPDPTLIKPGNNKVAARTSRRLRTRKELIILVPDDQLLRIPLKLPLATREHLPRVLHCQMSQLTPFEPEQVYFSYQIQDIDSANENLFLELLVIPRHLLHPHFEQFSQWHLKPTHLRPLSLAASSQCNLLSESDIETPKQPLKNLNRSLFALNLLLVAAVIALPLWQKSLQIDQLKSTRNLLKQDVDQVLEIRQKMDRLQELQQKLIAINAEPSNNLTLLAELTRLFPDTAWVNHMELSLDQIKLKGEALDASSLINRLDGSDLFNKVGFSAPTTRNPRSNKERFSINAELTERAQK